MNPADAVATPIIFYFVKIQISLLKIAPSHWEIWTPI